VELRPTIGIGDVKFGMTELEVIAVLGEPDLILTDEEDEEQNPVFQYNDLKLRLTFYTSENNRLLYIRTTHPSTQIKGVSIIDQPLDSFIESVNTLRKDWGEERYFSFNVYFYEDWWLTLHEEFGKITQVEFGATFIDDSEVYFIPD